MRNFLEWGDQFLEKIKKVGYFFIYLTTTCPPFRFLVIPKKLRQSQHEPNKMISVESNAIRNRLKNCHVNEHEISKLEHKPK